MVRRNQNEFNAGEKYPVKVAGVVFSNPTISSLSISEAGVFLVMADYFIQHALQHMQESDLVEMLTLHSISEESALKELKHLKIRGLVDQTPSGRVSIPSLVKAFESAIREADRRKTGWDKRRNANSDDLTGSIDDNRPSDATTPGVGSIDSLPDTQSKKTKAKKASSEQDAGSVLISSGADDATDVVAEIICDDGKVAKVTRGYALSNEKLYPGIDIVRQLSLMQAWCLNNPTRRKTSRRIRTFIGNWLQNALDKHHAMNAVTAGIRPQSQFGQGGNYQNPSNDADAAVAVSDGLDAFQV